MRIDIRQYAPIGQSCLQRTTRGDMKKILPLLIFAISLSACGGGSSDSVGARGVTSPSVSLIGTYKLIGNPGDMEIGTTRIYTRVATHPPWWSNGTYDYVVESSLSGEYIRAKVGTFTVYTFFIRTDDSATMIAWKQENNVMYEMFWEKVSDSTTLN